MLKAAFAPLFNVVTPAMFGGFLRSVITPWVTAGVGYAAAKGWVPGGDAPEITALLILAVTTVAQGAWSAHSHTVDTQISNIKEQPGVVVVKVDPAASPFVLEKATQAMAEVPGVKQVVTTAETAQATPSAKVVSASTPVV